MPSILDISKTALGGASVRHLRSRSLRFSRYAEPSSSKASRAEFFTDTFAIPPATSEHSSPLDRWLAWLQDGLQLAPTDLIFGNLQSRLALHLSGGVMENAGILLDRFGYPYIPGSGVKGIARRAALYALRTWCVNENGNRPIDSAEPAAAICTNNFKTPDDLAVAILRTFGWTDGEWKEGRTKRGFLRSDLEWAVGEGQTWLEARPRIAELLASLHGVKVAKRRPTESFAGRAQFLDAKPIATDYPTAPADLELDVVTCHHGDYYAGKLPEPHDTEDPVPVFFPTVAAGITFVFAVLSSDKTAAAFARNCLKVALSTFGAGAKTAAGYGWFEIEAASQTNVRRLLSERDARQRIEARTSLAPDLKLIAEFRTKKPDQIRGIINAFSAEERFWTNSDESYQLSLLHFLTVEDRTLYDAEKAKPKSRVMDAVRKLAAKFNRTVS